MISPLSFSPAACLLRPVFVVFFLAVSAIPGFAQTQAGEPETRAELLRREREAKQNAAEPYAPSGLERAIDFGETKIASMFNRDGVYSSIGSLTTGSAFSYRAGYRDRSLVHGRGTLDGWAGRSVKGYWAVELRSSYPLLYEDTLSLEGYGRRFTYPQEEFFGVGPDSERANQATYTQEATLFGTQLGWKPTRRFTLGGGVEHYQPTIRAGEGRPPSIDEIFPPPEREGFGVELSYLRSLAHVTYDYRQPLNARKGGYYRLDFSHFDDRKETFNGFSRLDLDLRQYVSFLAERRVLVGRVKIATTDADDASTVPFFMLPFLGGNDTLRGFRAYRFRGPHSILLQGEYRWEIWSAFEAALFVDAGKVAMERADVNFKNLEHDYGVGFRFNTDNGVVMRVDAAFGSKDGKHLHVVFGGLF